MSRFSFVRNDEPEIRQCVNHAGVLIQELISFAHPRAGDVHQRTGAAHPRAVDVHLRTGVAHPRAVDVQFSICMFSADASFAI